MRIVVALGGNAILERGEAPDADVQEVRVGRAADALAPVVRHHDVILTHGNGPQVGELAIESASDPALTRPFPFDAIGAETQGLIGYWLLNEIERAVPGRSAVCVVTRTEVDGGDPAFGHPTKFVGPVYTDEDAHHWATARGWDVRIDGTSWRRVVASPEPIAIVELDHIATLVDQGATVVCAGGGGVPVVRGPDGHLHGVEAVLDKDLTAALLAESLSADMLLVLTDVDNVQVDYGTATARPIGSTTVEDLRAMAFPAGSMGPKIDAVCRFVSRTGGRAAIGRLGDAERLVRGECGTQVGA